MAGVRTIAPSKYDHIHDANVVDRNNDIHSTPHAIGVNSATTCGHCKCYIQITEPMPGADDLIMVQSKHEIEVVINNWTNVTQANSDDEIT